MGGFLPFANLIPNLPDFFGKGVDYGVASLGGMPDSKARKNYIHDVRKLRRREYQDMVHSLKAAGLNPALAFGASPGHSGAQFAQTQLGSSAGGAGVGSAIAANRQAGVAESKAGSEIDLNTANSMLRGEERLNEVYRRAGLMQDVDKNAAWIEQTLQQARTSAAQQLLFEAEAKRAGASEAELRERTQQYDKFGLPGQSFMGGVRAFLGDAGGSGFGLNLNAPADRLTSSAKEAWKLFKDYSGLQSDAPTPQPGRRGR